MAESPKKKFPVCKIITVFNQKGGAGKSTVAMHLAGMFSLNGYKCLVADMDSQATSFGWSTSNPDGLPFPAQVENLSPLRGDLFKKIRQVTDNYDVIIVDCPAGMDPYMVDIPRNAMMFSDLAIIPVQPSPLDYRSTLHARELAMRAKEDNPALEIRFLINRYVPGTMISENIKSLLKDDPAVKVMKSIIGNRVGFAGCTATGNIINEMPGQTKAKEEIESMFKETLSILKGK